MYFLPDRKKAFTLIELLVVIAIIGLLISFNLIVLARYRDKAKDSRIETVLVQVRNIATGIYNDNNSYITVCSDGTLNDEGYSGLKVIEDEAYKFKRENPICYSSATAYCVQSSLVTGGYYCVDSSGVALKISDSYCAPTYIKCTSS